MARFPTRTLVLMVFTLLAFAWMYWQTHRVRPAPATLELIAPGGGAP